MVDRQTEKNLAEILGILQEHPGGLSISDIATLFPMNRNSVSKYLAILQRQGSVDMRLVGATKVYCPTRRLPVAALVLSSPALDPGLNRLQRLLLKAMMRLAPGRTMGNGLDPRKISHDIAVVEAYLADPLVHDRVSARLVAWLVAAGEGAIAGADGLAVDTLMLVAGDDALVSAEGSRRFAGRAPAGRVTLHCYEGLWHEVFNECPEDRARVLADLEAWLAPRTPAVPAERATTT